MIQIDRLAYIFNEAYQACTSTFVPVRIVRPDWMQGGVYVGEFIVNSIISKRWDKEGHFYYQDALTGRPTRVFLPIDNRGYILQEEYNLFFPGPFDRTVFNIPSYCSNATAVPFEQVKNAGLYDPKECFLLSNK